MFYPTTVIFSLIAPLSNNTYSICRNLRNKLEYLYITNSYLKLYNYVIRYLSIFYFSSFIDLSSASVDTNLVEKSQLSLNLNCLFYIYYLSRLDQKLIIITHSSLNNSVDTISTIFQNSMWGEREVSEMHGVTFKNKVDSRRLLLDFSTLGFPLIKTYPITGYIEISFNLILQWLEGFFSLKIDGYKTENIFE